MRSQNRKRKIAINILINISRDERNRAMKLGRLIKYILRKPHTKCGGETIPDPFSKKI